MVVTYRLYRYHWISNDKIAVLYYESGTWGHFTPGRQSAEVSPSCFRRMFGFTPPYREGENELSNVLGRRVLVDVGWGNIHFNSVGTIAGWWFNGSRAFLKIEVRRSLDDRGKEGCEKYPLRTAILNLKKFNERCELITADPP